MAVIQYTVTRIVAETRQILVDDVEFTTEHGVAPSGAEEHQLGQHLLETGVLERGEIVADRLTELTGPDEVFVLGDDQEVTGVQWRVSGFWNDDEIVIIDVSCAERTLGHTDDDVSGINHCGSWGDSVEVPLNASDEQIWAAARELADEYQTNQR